MSIFYRRTFYLRGPTEWNSFPLYKKGFSGEKFRGPRTLSGATRLHEAEILHLVVAFDSLLCTFLFFQQIALLQG